MRLRMPLVLLMLILSTVVAMVPAAAQQGDDLIPQARAAVRDARSRDPQIGSLVAYTWDIAGAAYTDALGCPVARANTYINATVVYQLEMTFANNVQVTYFVSEDSTRVVPCDTRLLQLPPVFDPDAVVVPTPIVAPTQATSNTVTDTTNTDTTSTDSTTTDETTVTVDAAPATTPEAAPPTMVVPQSDARLPDTVMVDRIDPPAIPLPASRVLITPQTAPDLQLVGTVAFPAAISALDIGASGDLVMNMYGDQGTASTFVYDGLLDSSTLEVVNVVTYNGFAATYRALTPGGTYFLETERIEGGQTALVLYEAATGISRYLPAPTGRFHLFDVAISEDDDTVVVAYERGRAADPQPGFTLVHISDDDVVELTRPNDTTITAVAIDADAQRVAGFDGFGIVYVMDVASGAVQDQFTVDFAGAGVLNFSHDGQYLAAGGFGPTIHLYDFAAGADILLARPYSAITSRPDLRVLEWSPDSRLLAAGGLEFPLDANTGKDVLIYDVAARALVASLPGPAYVEDLAFSPDGSLIFAIDDFNLYIYGVLPPAPPTTATPGN